MLSVVVPIQGVSGHFPVAQLPLTWEVSFHMLWLEILSSHETSISPGQEPKCHFSVHPRPCCRVLLLGAHTFQESVYQESTLISFWPEMGSADGGKERRKTIRYFKLSLLNFSGGKPFVADILMQEAELKWHAMHFKVKNENILLHAVVVDLSGLSYLKHTLL